jgi:hypothetical protein
MRRRYISPITLEEREANYVLRTAKRFERLGVPCPVGQEELDEIKGERDRLRQLRGYGKKQKSRKNSFGGILKPQVNLPLDHPSSGAVSIELDQEQTTRREN